MSDNGRPNDANSRKKSALTNQGDGLAGFEPPTSTRVVSFHLREDSAIDDQPSNHRPVEGTNSQRSNRSEATSMTFLSCRASMSGHSDDLSSNASYHSTMQHQAARSSAGSVSDKSDYTDNDFMSCRDDATVNTATGSAPVPGEGDDSFHSCRKFNAQGLRSILSETAAAQSANDDATKQARFNIPWHVVKSNMEQARPASSRRTLCRPWILCTVVILCLGSAAAVWWWVPDHSRNDDAASTSAAASVAETSPPANAKGSSVISTETEKSSAPISSPKSVIRPPTTQPSSPLAPSVAPTISATTSPTVVLATKEPTTEPANEPTDETTEEATAYPTNRHVGGLRFTMEPTPSPPPVEEKRPKRKGEY